MKRFLYGLFGIHDLPNDRSYERKYFRLLGLPRSGTTIISNYLNSQANGYCLIEPVWGFKLGKEEVLDELPFNASEVDGLIDLDRKLEEGYWQSSWQFGAIKETYRPWNSELKEYYDYLFDQKKNSIIYIFRNPAENFNSLKSMRWNPAGLDGFIPAYLELGQRALEHESPIIIYESFLDQKDKLLSAMLRQNIRPVRRIKTRSVDFGDSRANRSHSISEQPKPLMLEDDEVQQIEAQLGDMYQQLCSYSQMKLETHSGI